MEYGGMVRKGLGKKALQTLYPKSKGKSLATYIVPAISAGGLSPCEYRVIRHDHIP